MISVYLAGPFSESALVTRVRDALARRGIGCTSRWLREEVQLGGKAPDEAQAAKFARMDRYDIRRSQAVVMVNPEDYRAKGTGGRHVETGMGYMLSDMPVIVLGVESNIFTSLPEAETVPCIFGDPECFEDAIEALVERIRDRCVDYGPTWDLPEEQASGEGRPS